MLEGYQDGTLGSSPLINNGIDHLHSDFLQEPLMRRSKCSLAFSLTKYTAPPSHSTEASGGFSQANLARAPRVLVGRGAWPNSFCLFFFFFSKDGFSPSIEVSLTQMKPKKAKVSQHVARGPEVLLYLPFSLSVRMVIEAFFSIQPEHRWPSPTSLLLYPEATPATTSPSTTKSLQLALANS